MKIIGIVLIVLGIAGLAYGGISWTHQKNVVDLGPVQVTHDKTESLPIPPLAGVACLIAGAIVLVSDSRKAA
jgi:hypothetical protein